MLANWNQPILLKCGKGKLPQGREMISMKDVPWHEDDIFWGKLRPTMFTPSKMEAAKEEVTQLIELLEIKQDESILDLSCGIGRHANEFARRGYSVTGVDRTAYFLDKAIEIANRERLSVEYVLKDMREFSRANSFDVVLSMFTSFGYFEKQEENEMVLKSIQSSLKSGGRFLMEAMGKEVLARIFRKASVEIGEFGTVAVYRRPIEDWSKMWNQYIFIDEKNEVYRNELVHFLYSATEFKSLLRSAGFSKSRAFGGLDGCEYNESSNRLICIGWK
ncbi:MAG: class I SAM-dependent methyltransferase [Candidatus Thorarchaeota archaeon]|nr:class I SAM-dependent methyltransferase [Candidatus Thorarchaeota archaeon]